VYAGIKKGAAIRPERVELVEIDGPHPAGNVGVLINRIRPVNRGETVWTLNAADVLFIGRLFLKGITDFSRLTALTGSEMATPGYVKVIAGCTVDSLTKDRVAFGDRHVRLISGNVLTGTKVEPSDWLGAYDNQLTAIPEGDETDEFLGWGMPGFGKYSVSRSYFTWLTGKNREHVIDARIRGGRRAMIMSNEYDRVFPMDILPEYLLKAIIAFDIEKMENLGIYEVAPEDFALCEFVDTSKIELQKIVRNGLDLLYREMN
jgi:Na+-transporting NADH:ubiquinone oxidoreductase subunit A